MISDDQYHLQIKLVSIYLMTRSKQNPRVINVQYFSFLFK
uniref:Uncharacterized protein n=1 Tax=Myoviridae sp. ctCo31 TaxID=2825053 RepID=A0A8S5UMB4_9CAUD|nr:MAG TPA: hypothetical protein [Myoviridae sp. ctCo31]